MSVEDLHYQARVLHLIQIFQIIAEHSTIIAVFQTNEYIIAISMASAETDFKMYCNIL